MYFPYLTGRQEEMLALVGLAPVFRNSRLIVPIIKPFSIASNFVGRCLRVAQNGGRLAIIVNSNVGKPAPTTRQVSTLFNGAFAGFPANIFPALEIRPNTPVGDINTFVQAFRNNQVVFIHRNHSITAGLLQPAMQGLQVLPVQVFLDGGTPASIHFALPTVGSVILRDGFRRHTPNVNYPPQQHFDDILYSFPTMGYNGFGDFSIIGDITTIGGAAAKHVALHLTAPTGIPSLSTYHFVSTTPPTRQNPAAKYFNALNQLLNFTGNPANPPYNTAGISAYIQSHANQHFPNLGPPKRWSVMHHLELIDNVLRGRNSTPFI